MSEDISLHLLGLFLLFILSAFFSGSETALTALDRFRLKYLVEKKRPGAERLDRLIEHPDRLLSAILIGNNVVNIAASVFATALFIKLYGDQGELMTILVMTPVLLIFSEVCPKTYAAQNPERVSFLVMRPILLIMWLLTPLIWLVTGISRLLTRLFPGEADRPLISEDEIKSIISVGEQDGVVAEEQRRMLHGVFELSKSRVRDLMVPRTEVVGIEAGSSFSEVLSLVQTAHHSRFPVYRESLDSIVGIIHSKDILNYVNRPEEFQLEREARAPYFVPESKPVNLLLQSFRARKIHLAIVVDEYGGVEGIVTLEDVIEEVFGDIEDEYDVEEALISELGVGRFLIDGSLTIRDVNSRFDLQLSEEHVTTLAGYVLQALGTIPIEGEECTVDGIRLIVRKMDDQRVEEIELDLSGREDRSPD
jgi:putative hemolysin